MTDRPASLALPADVAAVFAGCPPALRACAQDIRALTYHRAKRTGAA